MATKKNTESAALTKILDQVHEDVKYRGFCDKFAEHFSIENMGHDPVTEPFDYFMQDSDGAETMSVEKRGWMKVSAVLCKELQKQGKPLTIREGIKLFDASPKKYQKLYGGR